MFFLWGGEGDGAVESGDADDGAVEVVERLLINDGSDFSGEASGAGVLVEDDDFVRLLYCGCDGFAVDGDERAQVEDFDFDIFFGENFGGFERS